MGIYSRDYYRQDSRRFVTGSWLPDGCKWLIIINVVVFVLQIVSMHKVGMEVPDDDRFEVVTVTRSSVTELLELGPDQVLHGQVWRLLTSAFCHEFSGSFPWHILINMVLLGWFGKSIEQIYGTREFVLFYLTAACVSGIVFVILAWITGSHTPAIGASGAVMAVMVVYVVHFPREVWWIYGIIPVENRFLLAFYVLYDLFPVIMELSGMGQGDNVAHSAHLGGLAFGYLYYRNSLRLDQFYTKLRLRRPRTFSRNPSVRIYKPSVDKPENLDRKVDAILKKYSEQGEASLTDQEREVLMKASERYKGNQSS